MQDDNQAQYKNATRLKMQEEKILFWRMISFILLVCLCTCWLKYEGLFLHPITLTFFLAATITVSVGLGLYIAYLWKKYRPLNHSVYYSPPSIKEILLNQPDEYQSGEVDHSEEPNVRFRGSASYALHRQPERLISQSPEVERKSGTTSEPDEMNWAKNQAPCCIGKEENNKMLKVISQLRNAPEFSLTIPSMLVNNDRVTVMYLVGQHDYNEPDQPDQHPEEDKGIGQNFSDKKCLENLEEKLRQKYLKPQIRSTEERVQMINFEDNLRDITLVRDALKAAVPGAKIQMVQIQQLPRFVSTDGLSSKLISIDSLNVRHRIGCTTALLIGVTSTTDYALTVGHLTNLQDTIHIQQDNGLEAEIGVVVERAVGSIPINGADMYFDAALIRLHKNAIEDLELTQHFLINNTPHTLTVAPQSPQVGRVVLRAIDQTSDDIKGIVMSNWLHIFEGSMYGCTQIARYNEGGIHVGIIHNEGESGLLGTYEPALELPERVQPVVMLIGLYPEFEENGEYVSHYSVGIDLERIVNRFVQSIGEQLQIRTSLPARE